MADGLAIRLKQTLLVGVAVGLLALLRIMLSLMPYRRLASLVSVSGGRRPPGWVKTRNARALAHAVKIVPFATCLPQAITGHLLFRLQGYSSTVRVGVAPVPGSGFRAHAWLVCEEDVIVGGSEDLPLFRPLVDLGGAGR